MTGCDISHYQTITDFAALAKAAEFVILKATEGTGYRDPTYTSRIATLRVQRARVGSYHFASTGAAIAEADAYLAYAKPAAGDILALDVEARILTRLPGQQLVTWCKTWLDHVKARTGITPHIYMSLSVVQGRDWSSVAATYPLWLAAYMATMPATKWWTKPTIWQYTSTGRIAGIPGDVDLDKTIAVPKPDPKPTTPASNTASDPLEDELMAPVTFTDANEVAALMAAGVSEKAAREKATTTYSNGSAALAGLLNFVSSVLRDVKALQADVAALKGASK